MTIPVEFETAALGAQALTAPEPASESVRDPEIQPSLSDYNTMTTQFDQLAKDWQPEFAITREQRIFRYIEIDVQLMRSQGFLKDDETVLPVRVAERNIRREQPGYVAFYTQSRRSLIFRESKTDLDRALSTSDEERLEDAFTQGMRYPGWELAPYAATDGAQTHGWDSIEVVYDETKPLKVGLEHIGHDKLLFPREALDIQYCEYIARGYDLTEQQLRSFVTEFDFDAAQVAVLVASDKGTGHRTLRHYRVWKILFKEGGIVKVGWRCDAPATGQPRAGNMCSDWLKKPVNLYLGRTHKEMQEQPPVMMPVYDQLGMPMLEPDMLGMPAPVMRPVPQPPIEITVDDVETEYPIYLLRYHQTEDQQIFSTRGRVFLDRYDQEAQTAIASGFVNKLMRSTNVYAAVGQDGMPGNSAAPKQLPVKLQHGAIYDKPVNFFSSEAPEPILLSALQYFGVRNAEENGQTDFAVNNRVDSRKTATEIQAASQQANLLSGVQVTIYSAWICAFYSRAWQLVQNMALSGKIEFLATTQPDGVTVGNDVATIDKSYYVRAAGDIDVTQRSQQIQQMLALWPIISQTPAAQSFLRDLLIVSFPNSGKKWAQVIQDDMVAKQLLAQVSQVLESLIMSRPEELKQLPPQDVQMLLQLKQQVAMVLNPAGQQVQPGIQNNAL